MRTLVIVMLFAIVAPILCEDQALEPKKQEKRGVLGLGYGSYLGGHGYGYNGLGHGYLGSPYYSSLAHAPVVSHSSYAAPLAVSHGYSGYHAPLYSAPYSRLAYPSLGHGLGHYNYW